MAVSAGGKLFASVHQQAQVRPHRQVDEMQLVAVRLCQHRDPVLEQHHFLERHVAGKRRKAIVGAQPCWPGSISAESVHGQLAAAGRHQQGIGADPQDAREAGSRQQHPAGVFPADADGVGRAEHDTALVTYSPLYVVFLRAARLDSRRRAAIWRPENKLMDRPDRHSLAVAWAGVCAPGDAVVPSKHHEAFVDGHPVAAVRAHAAVARVLRCLGKRVEERKAVEGAVCALERHGRAGRQSAGCSGCREGIEGPVEDLDLLKHSLHQTCPGKEPSVVGALHVSALWASLQESLWKVAPAFRVIFQAGKLHPTPEQFIFPARGKLATMADDSGSGIEGNGGGRQFARTGFRSKVILKGLPPSITEQHCRDLLRESTRSCMYFNFVPGRPPNPSNPLAPTHTASIILDFQDPDELLAFSERWQGRECKEGSKKYSCVVDFWPRQKHFVFDSMRSREEAKGKRGELESLELYRYFVEKEFGGSDAGGCAKADEGSSFLTAEKHTEMLRQAETRAKPWLSDPYFLKRTPLLEHVEKMKQSAAGKHQAKTSTKKPKAPSDTAAEPKPKKQSGKKGTKKGKQKAAESSAAVPAPALPSGFYFDKSPSSATKNGGRMARGRNGPEDAAGTRKNSSDYGKDTSEPAELKIYDLSIGSDDGGGRGGAGSEAKPAAAPKLKEYYTKNLKKGRELALVDGTTAKQKVKIVSRTPSSTSKNSEAVKSEGGKPRKFEFKKAASSPEAGGTTGGGRQSLQEQQPKKRTFSVKTLKQESAANKHE